MTKSLAGYTPDHRANFVGMWCEISGESWPYVLVGAYTNGYAFLYAPSVAHEFCTALENVTPLLDYPRAWQPDGTPVKGRWHTRRILDSYSVPTDASYYTTHTDIGARQRRFTTAWEPIPGEEDTNG